jgi:hypothetical protein
MQSNFRTTTFIGEGDAVRSAAGEAFDDNTAGGDAHDFGVTQAGFAGGGAGFAFATATHAGWAAAVHIPVTIPDNGANAIGADPQLHILCACRDGCGDGYQGYTECQTRSF